MAYQVSMFASDVKELYEKIKRGSGRQGDLFGMWTNSGSAVIYVVLDEDTTAKGKHIRDVLQERYKLCHVGKWNYNPFPSSSSSKEPGKKDREAAKEHCKQPSVSFCILLAVDPRSDPQQSHNITAYLFYENGREHHIAEFCLRDNLFPSYPNPFKNALDKLRRESPPMARQAPVARPEIPSRAREVSAIEFIQRIPISNLNSENKSLLSGVLNKLVSMATDPGNVTLKEKNDHPKGVLIRFQLHQVDSELRFPFHFPHNAAKLSFEVNSRMSGMGKSIIKTIEAEDLRSPESIYEALDTAKINLK